MLKLRSRISLCIALMGSIGWATAQADEAREWAGYRGPQVAAMLEGQSFSEFGKLGLREAWKVSIGSGYSGISIADGRVVTQYAEGESDVIAAFDAASGRKLWSYAFGKTYPGHDGSHDGPVATPLIADGRVFGLGAYGEFFAVDAATGKEIWKVHLKDELEIEAPFYGFGTSPIYVGGMLILELGGDDKAIAGFDPATGKMKWSAASDAVGYQVPVPAELGGRPQLVGAGESKLFGVDPASGELLWEWAHGGRGGRGAHSMTPIPIGNNRLFLAYKDQSSAVVELVDGKTDAESGEDDAAEVFRTVWEERSIRNSYNVPVYHDGHLYAYSSRFLTCVDAETGESKWRSREPGDGFLIVVDGHLVIVTKQGSLHVAEASPEGYKELASAPAFEDLSWTAPSFAGGSIYARSLGELARFDLTSGVIESRIDVASRGVGDSAFAKFLGEVDAASDGDKAAIIERYLAAQKSFPIIEGDDQVHFVYYGAAKDVALAGDLIGARQEQAMTRVPGTDLFHHSVEILPNARVNYLFIKDYEEILDPRNPRRVETTMLGKDMEFAFDGKGVPMSWLAMPGWQSPAHLEEAPEVSRGKVESHKMVSNVLKEAAPPAEEGAPETPDPEISVAVYVPHGYESSEEPLPVVYVHGGSAALEHGKMPNSLDNLIGKSVAPVIVAFVDIPGDGPPYFQAFAQEVVPFVDKTYRTVAEPASRANFGHNFLGVNALVSTLQMPELFGKAAAQSLVILTFVEEMIYPLIEGLGENLPQIYLDWGAYDMRNPHENWDGVTGSRKMARALKDKGIQLAGGEVPDGTDWASWRNRTDKVFEALFPLAQ